MNDILTNAVVRAMRSMEGFEPQPLGNPESLGTVGLTALFASLVTGQKTAMTTCLTTIRKIS